MSPADVEEVLAIERASFRFPWSSRTFLSDLALPYTIWRVARPAPGQSVPAVISRRPSWGKLLGRRSEMRHTRPLLGYAGVQVVLDEGHITNLAVHPDHRRRGIGEMLLQDLIEQVQARGVLRVTLEVRVSNLAAQRLYHKYGFDVEGRRLRYYGDGEDALIMWTGRLDMPEMQTRLADLRRQLWLRVGG